MAAERAYPGCEAIPCAQFEDAFAAVEAWGADRAVLPVENSLGGSIHRNYDLLLRHSLHIVGEVNFPVSHCLLALPGVPRADIKRALSHPQALSQCEGYLKGLGLVLEAVDDTAGAAQAIAKGNLRDAAAVASRRAAELYGLDVLAEGIQDNTDNVTRFVALARDVVPPRATGAYKTSVVFSLNEGPGVLFRALSCFALRDIDLTKIESRPMRWQPLSVDKGGPDGGPKALRFAYLFYVDFLSSMADVKAQNALRHLGEMASFLRVLGSYPADTTTGMPGAARAD